MDAKLEKKIAEQGNNFWSDFWKWVLIFWFAFESFFLYFYQGDTYIYNIKTLILSSVLVLPFFAFTSLLISGYSNRNKIKNGDITILSLYKIVSNYNTNPVRALFVLFILIILSWIVFMLLINGFSLKSFVDDSTSAWKIFEYSFTNAIPFLDPFDTKDLLELLKKTDGIYELFFKVYLYLEKILSAGVILLFGLSLRRKFKR